MTKTIRLLLLGVLIPALASATGWNDATYKQIEKSIQPAQLFTGEYPITQYGASTSATPLQNQKAIQKAIDRCSKRGGGRVVVPAGEFQTGAIVLKSRVNLVLSKDAVLKFVFPYDLATGLPTMKDAEKLYPIVETSWEGLECYNLSPCIYANNAEDIAITGQGTIDGGGSNKAWWPWNGKKQFGWHEGLLTQKSKNARPRLLQNGEDGVPMRDAKGKPTQQRTFTAVDALRPQLVNFVDCQRVLIEDVTLLDSPFWVIHPYRSTDITVHGVTINNDGPNGDGCDPESCDRVLIERCRFNTGDDCIAIKSGRNRDGRERAMPSQNIIIRHCEMKNGHGGVVIGSEISGGCKNVFAHDCQMDSPDLERVLRIKTNSCRGGVIENINMRDVTVGQCAESVVKINLDYEPDEVCCRGNNPTVRNVNVDNVTCQRSKYGVQIIGLNDETQVYDINVSNCHFNGVSDGNFQSGKVRDVRFDNLFVNGSLVLQQKPYKHYSEWMTYSEMQRTPLPYLLDFSSKPKWSYVMGIELEGMLDTYLRYGGQKIMDYCKLYTDTMINERGDIRNYDILDYNLDNIRTGHFVTRMYQQLPEKKNLIAMQTMMKQLKEQPRTVADKVFWHKAIYAYQVWLDGIFMGLPYRCLTAPITCSKKGKVNSKEVMAIYDDAVNQLTITYNRTLDPKTGLNRHAYDENRNMFWADKETGLSQHCWGRAQGWFTMALIEVLDAVPEDYARRQELIDLLQKDLDAVVKWQDKKTGLWYQVMDAPGREGNYLESTCSSMFAYVLLKAARKGYVGSKYRDAGIKAYQGIIDRFIRVNADKTISLTQCCAVAGLGPGISPQVEAALKKINPKAKAKENKRRDGSYAYYLSEEIRDNDAKGLGPFLWASLEMEQLGYDTDNVMKPIDRKAVVSRNNPTISEADPLASLTVGNGHFATTVDVTGLQSFPFDYEAGVPLTAMSDWAWHKFENTGDLKPSDTQKSFDLGHGHQEVYAVEYKTPAAQEGVTERNVQSTLYFRANPHRLNLGTIGLEMKKADGTKAILKDLSDIRQELRLYDGTIDSHFIVDGHSVDVTTAALQDRDALLCRIASPLLQKSQAGVSLRFSYPTGRHADDANDWTQPQRHTSTLISQGEHHATIERTLDSVTYYIYIRWEGHAALQQRDRHDFLLSTTDDHLAFEVEYSKSRYPDIPLSRNNETSTPRTPIDFNQQLRSVRRAWNSWWQQGAIIDFSQCTDPRAKELERRVVLSQYLTQVNCANATPPQETGLTYNSWFGRPHLEMTWWHTIDFALWNRPQVLATVLDWYNDVAYPVAKQIAQRQGFRGIRWMKMTDPWAGEAPSNTGSFLIWQQPHYIYMAEEMYRANPTAQTLKKYAHQVEQTAAFMADFLSYKSHKSYRSYKSHKSHKSYKSYTPQNTYFLQGSTAMQESMSKDFSFNHPFELAYWQYGLTVANRWRERLGLARNEEWDDMAMNLSQLPMKDGIYTAGLPKGSTTGLTTFDPFDTVGGNAKTVVSSETFDEKSRRDHPAVLGACGLLPLSPRHPLYDPATMTTTLDWVMKNWEWATLWGWDFGMTAMTAARLGQPKVALDALFMDTQKNTYLKNGHNFQTADRLRIYLPGNGALLTAVAMMCAGWDGCLQPLNPGFPQDGSWNVRWEGLQRMQ